MKKPYLLLKVIYVPIVLFRNKQKANHLFMQYPINKQFTPPTEINKQK